MSSTKGDINSLITEFVSKANISEVVIQEDDMSEYKNGDVLKEDEKFITVYSTYTDKREIKLNKDFSTNTILTIQLFLNTVGIKSKAKLKKDLILQLMEYFEEGKKDEDSDDEMESSDDEEEYSDISEEQVREVFDKLFIDWEYTEMGKIKGTMKRKVLEFLIKDKISKKVSKFEKEGYPVKLNTENREDEFIEVIYKDGDKKEKLVKIEKVPISEYENISL